MMATRPPGDIPIRAVLQQLFSEAIAEGQPSVRVRSEDVHVAAGQATDIASCCQMMVREMGPGTGLRRPRPKGWARG